MTVLVQLVLLVCGGLFDAADAKARSRYYDALVGARCEAHCWTTANRAACVKACLAKPFDKPGLCPKNDTILAPFDAVCMDTCSQDSQCSALTKCCSHSCGITCQSPQELLSAVGIPDVPHDVKVTEGPKKRTILLEWKSTSRTPNNSTILYLIEERHHTGHNFIEKHLSEWSVCGRTVKTSHVLKNFVKPGRWYQFRVAAVNENGTKGFSHNSPTFNIALRPKPPKAPQNVTVSALWKENGTLVGELRWSPPKSDLPIQRYKVFWSRRLYGVKPLDSVLVHQQVVSKDQTKFLLQDLQPNSLYFLQIQALVQYGKKRLKGQKSGLVLNTTNYINVTYSSSPAKSVDSNKIEGLHVDKKYWSQEGLRVRISWKPKRASARFAVSLWNGSCSKGTKNRKYFRLVATTKASHFDLSDLQFDCKYKVGVRLIPDEDTKGSGDTFITFETPKCQEFKRKYRKLKCTN